MHWDIPLTLKRAMNDMVFLVSPEPFGMTWSSDATKRKEWYQVQMLNHHLKLAHTYKFVAKASDDVINGRRDEVVKRLHDFMYLKSNIYVVSVYVLMRVIRRV